MERARRAREREVVLAILHQELLFQPRGAAPRRRLEWADKNPGCSGIESFISDSGQFKTVADTKGGCRLIPVSVAK